MTHRLAALEAFASFPEKAQGLLGKADCVCSSLRMLFGFKWKDVVAQGGAENSTLGCQMSSPPWPAAGTSCLTSHRPSEPRIAGASRPLRAAGAGAWPRGPWTTSCAVVLRSLGAREDRRGVSFPPHCFGVALSDQRGLRVPHRRPEVALECSDPIDLHAEGQAGHPRVLLQRGTPIWQGHVGPRGACV